MKRDALTDPADLCDMTSLCKHLRHETDEYNRIHVHGKWDRGKAISASDIKAAEWTLRKMPAQIRLSKTVP